ncbi:MAG TPA: hypothetical protein VNV66_02115, partial [Pilimelia sp.]|nr:hypothetical protein [Pilimelia sp.]
MLHSGNSSKAWLIADSYRAHQSQVTPRAGAGSSPMIRIWWAPVAASLTGRRPGRLGRGVPHLFAGRETLAEKVPGVRREDRGVVVRQAHVVVRGRI